MKFLRYPVIAFLLFLSANAVYSASSEIYPTPDQAKADLSAALRAAAKSHKRILIGFGGNWCGDCRVLDIYLHDARNQSILEANYILVHINIGRMDANLDIARRYGVPVEKGVPAMVVLSDRGTLLYSQKNGEFEAMHRIESAVVTQFLVQWKPRKSNCSVVSVNC